jgi:DNA polymerase
MQAQIHCDVETASALDIAVVGAHQYFAHPSTKVLMLAYRAITPSSRPVTAKTAAPSSWERDRPELWIDGQPIPAALSDPDFCVVAFNAAFERQAFHWLTRHRGFPMPAAFRCTQAIARMLSLPDKLAHLCQALGLPPGLVKDARGEELIELFSIRQAAPWNHPEEWRAFGDYCRQDVVAECACEDVMMLRLNADEQRAWELSETINQRGIRFDRASLEGAIRITARLGRDYDRPMAELTQGAVPSIDSTVALRRWIVAQGVDIPDVKRTTLEQLTGSVPAVVRKVLDLRLNAGKSSVKKLRNLPARLGHDDRLRGAYLYHGAHTGRWTSVGVNVANFPRTSKAFNKLDAEALFAALAKSNLDGYPDWQPLHLVADSIRSLVQAAPGHRFIQADYAQIESAVIAWLADDIDKLALMAAMFDDPALPDNYQIAAGRILDRPVGKDDDMRQIGKVAELALGFAGGVGALARMANTYKVDFEPLFPVVRAACPDDVFKRAVGLRNVKLSQKDQTALAMPKDAWLAADIVKRQWRAAHGAIVEFWHMLEHAALSAVAHPGQRFGAGRVSMKMWGNRALTMRLPSGRNLFYPLPRLKARVEIRKIHADGGRGAPEPMDIDKARAGALTGQVEITGPAPSYITFADYALHAKDYAAPHRQPLKITTLSENATQAVARDILVHGMQQIEAAGYRIVMHVYDEVVAEMPIGSGSLDEMCALLTRRPAWAAGLPLKAEGYEATRYRKD